MPPREDSRARSPSRPSPRLPSEHALLVPRLTDLFERLGVSASVWWQKLSWRAIHLESDVQRFELRYGADRARVAYNTRCMNDAVRSKRTVVGQYAGWFDYFVPILRGSKTVAFLAVGPVAEERAESATTLERWHELTGRQGHLVDPELAEYVSAVLGTLVLDARQRAALQSYLECLAQMMAGTGNASRLAARAERLRGGIEAARNVERTWENAHSMVDERTTRSWPTPHRLDAMRSLGLDRVPEDVLVALMVSSRAEPELVDDLVRRDAFQRACVALARDTGRVVSGKVGDSGVSFLSAIGGSASARRRQLLELGEATTRLARRSGFELHLGIDCARQSSSLAAAFQSALGAAEQGLARREHVVWATVPGEAVRTPLSALPRDLVKLTEEQPRALPARFERYLEAVGRYTGYRRELAQAHLEFGLERIVQSFRDREALEEKSYRHMLDDLARAALNAGTLRDLFDAYRRAVRDIVEAIEAPTAARRDRSLRRALLYIRAHFTEPLNLVQVAKIAGFAPNHFSQLFKRREKTTFKRYLRGLRVARAKHLLGSTDLALQRVAPLSGFASPSAFATIFRRSVGMTPSEFRTWALPQAAVRRGSAEERVRRRDLPKRA